MSEAQPSILRAWRSKSPAFRRRLLGLFVGLPGLFVAIMLATNILLWTGTIEHLASRRYPLATVEIQVGRAWMLWPGKIHVRDFEIDIDAYTYQLHVGVPSGVVDIALLDLMSREFHTRSVHGEDVSIWVVMKKPAEQVDEGPGVPEFADFGPPIRSDEPPEIPPRDQSWTIDIDGIDGQISELIVGNTRLRIPTGGLRASIHAVPGHSFSIPDANVDLSDASLTIGDRVCISDISLEVEFDIAEYNPFGVDEPSTLGKVSAAGSIHASVDDMAPLVRYFPAAAGDSSLGGGRGQLSGDVVIESGVVRVGSELRYDTQALWIYAGKFVFEAATHLRAAVEERDGNVRSYASANLERVRGGVVGDDLDAIQTEQVEASVAFANDDLTGNWPIHDLSVWIPRLIVEDLGALASLSDTVRLERGSVELHWTTDRGADGDYDTAVSVKLGNGALAFGETKMRGSVHVRVEARTQAALDETTVHGLELELDGFALTTPRGHSEGTWVRVTKGRLTINHDNGSFDGTLHGRLDDLRPVLAQSNARQSRVREVRDLDLTQPLDFDLGLHRHGSSFTLDINDLSRPGLNIRGKLHHRRGRTRFAILLVLAHVGIYGEAGEEPKVDLFTDADWLARKSMWVDGKSDGKTDGKREREDRRESAAERRAERKAERERKRESRRK